MFLQFIVDMQAKIEAERLLYIRQNQSKLRTDEYIHLRVAIANDGDIENLGRLVILPSSFTGSPRHMQEYAQDAMTYVRKYGRPDLFITFTCNSSWKEIKDELQYGQKPHDRHDIIARVFRQKQVKFIKAVVKSCIFGEVISWMYSIEWQKRGLPHSHNLIWLKEKIHSNQIDEVIKAEFPNPLEDLVLYEIIVKDMIHGPCGILNMQSPCMKNNKCSKRYPRSFLSETVTGNDRYPKYRRRPPSEGGFTAKIKVRGEEIEIDNRWVVPYNPLLSKMFKAHINVEYCSSVKSIKYVCKYINKGSDMAVFGITDENRYDEILRYQMGRYISSNEAVWRILGFPIHDRNPAVFHLSVHLENGQRVYFTSQTAQKVVNQPLNTTLTAFFKLCQNDPFAKTLFYPDVPSYYTWDTSRRVFSRQKKGISVEGFDGVFRDNAIGRVYMVHPKNAECFYLRLLLHEVRGPTSFEDLRTVDGYICEKYREACQRRGLLENDNHWQQTMKEAAETAKADQLKELFAIILTSCNPSNPNKLWLNYRDSMSDDILARVRKDNDDMDITFNENIYNEALIILEDRCLAMNNQSLVTLGVQSPIRSGLDVDSSELMREVNYNTQELQRYIEESKPKLTQTQLIVYNTIMNRIKTGEGGIIFLDAPGGTGKTFLINLILATIRVNNEVALALASSGIAATLMEGGRTAHSTLNLPLNVAEQEFPVCNITRSSVRGKILMQCKIIIWDEYTMAHRKSLEALDRTLEDLRKNTRLMGGLLLLLSGDFRQTLPVIPKSTPADEINACLKRLLFWNNVEKLSLTENMRAIITRDPKAQEFAENLLKIGNGTYPLDPQSSKLILTEELCNVIDTEEQLIEKVYPSIEQNYLDRTWLCERAILATKNDVVQQINEKIQNMIPGEEKIYKSIDTMMDQDETVNFPTEFLNSLNPPSMSPHELKLKIGSPVILIRNLNSPKLCNGTRLCVKQILNNVIEAVILTGKEKGKSVFIPRIPIISNDLPFCFKRLQFPLRFAYSLTINKAQGQTFRYCGVNLKESRFLHGQLYVAFSRVGQTENLFVYAPEQRTVNVVYKNVF